MNSFDENNYSQQIKGILTIKFLVISKCIYIKIKIWPILAFIKNQ